MKAIGFRRGLYRLARLGLRQKLYDDPEVQVRLAALSAQAVVAGADAPSDPAAQAVSGLGQAEADGAVAARGLRGVREHGRAHAQRVVASRPDRPQSAARQAGAAALDPPMGEARLGRPGGDGRSGGADRHDDGEAALRVRVQAVHRGRRGRAPPGRRVVLAGHRDLRGALPGAGAVADAVPVQAIQVDGGGEFCAEFEQACQKRQIPLIVLPPQSPKMNSRVEYVHGTCRREFYECTEMAADLEGARRQWAGWEDTYNRVRPHEGLGLKTPVQYISSRSSSRACSQMP